MKTPRGMTEDEVFDLEMWMGGDVADGILEDRSLLHDVMAILIPIDLAWRGPLIPLMQQYITKYGVPEEQS